MHDRTTKSELDKIRKWECGDIFSLVSFIRSRWRGFEEHHCYWGKDEVHNGWVLGFDLHAGGWGDNEAMVNALLKNKMVTSLWYERWERGGHHYFKIDPCNIGYVPVTEYCTANDISKQYVYHHPEKFNWIHVSAHMKFIKEKI